MDNQPTTTRQFLMQNWSKTNQLSNQYSLNSNKQKATKAGQKIQALKSISTNLIKYLLNSILTSDINIQNIFTTFAKQYDIRGIDIKLILGYTIKQQLCKNGLIKKIQQQFIEIVKNIKNIKNDNDDSLDSDNQIQIDFGDDVDEQSHNNNSTIMNTTNINNNQPQNFYARSQNSQTPMQLSLCNTSSNINNISLDQSTLTDTDISITNLQSKLNNDMITNQNQQVRQYLYKLSQSTTQLSYLCQRMKWTQPQFQQEKSKINQILFSCVIKVNVTIKQKYIVLQSSCPAAVSKKQAKRIASLFMLRKIYNRFPQSWKKFSQSKKTNPVIQQPLNANNQQIFEKAKFNIIGQMFKDQDKMYHNKNQMNIHINKYLDQIKSYKAQINVFQGKHNKKISPVQFQRSQQDQYTLWPVKAQIRDGMDIIQAQAKQASKKLAEEVCCRQLLLQLYARDVKRWEEFKIYKRSKNI